MVPYLFCKCKLSKHRKEQANLHHRTSKTLSGQAHYGHLLVPGQVENFTISTPLHPRLERLYGILHKYASYNNNNIKSKKKEKKRERWIERMSKKGRENRRERKNKKEGKSDPATGHE